MGYTLKDQKGQRTFPNVYEIVRRKDGSFDIFRNGEIAHPSIPEQWLEDELTKYGICGQEYRDARYQLNEFGKARLEFRSGCIEALLAEGKHKMRIKSRHGSKGN